MAKRNWMVWFGVLALGVLPSCADLTSKQSAEAMPAAGDTAQALPPFASAQSLAPSTNGEPPAPAPQSHPKHRKVAKDEVTVIASTAWQDDHTLSQSMPMPASEPVTVAELKQAAPVEANPGMLGFFRRHLLVLLSALCLGSLGVSAFHLYPARRNSGGNRYG